jgi:hypothetical protein
MDLDKRLVIEAFADTGWRVPELLGRVEESEDPVLRFGEPGATAAVVARTCAYAFRDPTLGRRRPPYVRAPDFPRPNVRAGTDGPGGSG